MLPRKQATDATILPPFTPTTQEGSQSWQGERSNQAN
nr:MAG TPA: hypothetical protein [Caudoviricetes sp.]